MGWASASEYPIVVGKAMKKARVSYAQRLAVYKALCKSLQEGDWDTEDECYGFDSALDEALLALSGNEIVVCDREWKEHTATVDVVAGVWRADLQREGGMVTCFSAKSRDRLINLLEKEVCR